MRPEKAIIAVLLLAFCLATGCVHTFVKNGNLIPEGFAPYTKAREIKAASPEGVTYRVRSEDNKPFAQLPFWKEALKKRMLDAGYIFLNEAPIKTDGEKGYLLELTAPYGAQDYTYLVAVFVREKKIVIAEAAGEVGDLSARRDAIVEAIQNLKF
jgi:hypothetical protein